jgi:hypothetical protein
VRSHAELSAARCTTPPPSAEPTRADGISGRLRLQGVRTPTDILKILLDALGTFGMAAIAIAHLSSPEVPEPIRCQLGVAHRVLDVLVAEICLQRAGVVAGVGQGVAAAVPQHVRVAPGTACSPAFQSGRTAREKPSASSARRARS